MAIPPTAIPVLLKDQGDANYAKRGVTQTLDQALPHTVAFLANHNDATPVSLKIGGLGSSVGVGASTPEPVTQSPSARLAIKLAGVLSPLGNITIAHTNGSVNGTSIASTVTGDNDYADLKTAAGGPVKIVNLAFGMNDGFSGAYHVGQTYPGVYSFGADLIRRARADGSDVTIMTTPHPHTVRSSWVVPTGTTTSYPAAGQQIPDSSLAQSIKTITLPSGKVIPISYRHFRVNEQFRRLANDFGCVLLDAEAYWFEAVAKHGEDALFNSTEFNHPNLLGHQESYWKAIDEFVDGLRRPSMAGGMAPFLVGRVGINTLLPSAGLHQVNPVFGEAVVRFDRAVNPSNGVPGGRAFQIDDDGATRMDGAAFVGGTLTVRGKIETTLTEIFNIGSANPQTLVTCDSTGDQAVVTATGYQGGVGTYSAVYLVQGTAAGATRFSTLSTVGEAAVFSVAISGRNLVATPGFSNTNLRWTVDKTKA